MWVCQRKPEQEIENPFIKEFPLGSRFKYLGATMVVTAHYDHFAFVLSGTVIPKLIADYIDGNGVLRQAAFSVSELPGLISEQATSQEPS